MIETRKQENRYFTSDPSKMLGKYTTSRVIRTWNESYVSENGQVQSLERHELILDRGVYISNDVLTEIKFWLDEGSLSGIEVSNQKRMSIELENTRMYPFRACVSIEGKKHSFLLYASSVTNAIEIINDYVELNHTGGFFITELKQLDYCVILVDKLKTIRQRNIELDIAYLKDEISVEEYINNKIDETEHENPSQEDGYDDTLKLKFYQIGAKILMRLDDGKDIDDEEYNQTFIVKTFSATRANMIIEKYLQDQQELRYQKSLEHPDRKFVKKTIMSFIEESKIINCGEFIPKAFSEAYKTE